MWAPLSDYIFSYCNRYQPRENVPNYPREIAGLIVTTVVDLTTGYDSTNPPDFKPKLPLSSGQMIQFRAENLENRTNISLTIR
jgi:phosphoglucomutase